MKTIMLFLFTANVLIAPLAFAEDIHVNKSCGELPNMIAINACAGEQYKKADDELNRLFKEKISAIETPKNKDRFRDAQRAWITFRDKVCLYEARDLYDQESGSSWGYHHDGCMEFYTKKRIEDLKVNLQCVTDDCPN